MTCSLTIPEWSHSSVVILICLSFKVEEFLLLVFDVAVTWSVILDDASAERLELPALLESVIPQEN